MNLSLGGMFIRTADPPPVGTRFRLEVEWASTVIPLAEAEVMWSRTDGRAFAAGFGVRFTHVSEQTRTLLDAMMKHGGGRAAMWAARETAAAAVR